MSKFNSPKVGSKTVNRAGGEAYKQSDKMALVNQLLTNFLNDQFYRSGQTAITDLAKLVYGLPDKKFAAKVAVYARDQFNMRSASHVVAGEIAGQVKGEQWTKSFFEKIVIRPDDMSEILSCYKSIYGNTEPNSLKKGFAKALEKLDDYRAGKYKLENKGISLVDMVNLCHPKPTDTLNKLMKGNLQPPQTWEVLLTQAGSDKEKKNKVWYDLLAEDKLGYMALLRNLRNILGTEDQKIIEMASEALGNTEKIKKSRVLPFRFATAMDEMEKLNLDGTRLIIKTLSQAMDIAVENIPTFDGRTLVVLDESGSMGGRPAQIGSLFSAILLKANDNADFMTFDSSARYRQINPLDSTLSIAKSIKFSAGGTNFRAIFQEANKAYDRIIILSDMQGWIGYNNPKQAYQEYCQTYSANPMIYSFDLQGYGDMQFPESNVTCIAGFSEKVFDLIKLAETDKNAIIHEIEKVEL